VEGRGRQRRPQGLRNRLKIEKVDNKDEDEDEDEDVGSNKADK
jgi:hypothetical protein